MKAWYFSTEEKKLRYDDNRDIKIGGTHEIQGEPILCKHGLHGSVNILDALDYAPGPIVYRVELSGKMDIGIDKISAQKRTYLEGGVDISDVLREFTRWCALQVINLWDAPDVVREYLETGKEELRDAARDAARAAARAAARDTAWAAAWAAARGATRAATRAAARDAQNKKLEEMVMEALK